VSHNATQRLSHGTQAPPCRFGLDWGSIGSRSCAMLAVFDISIIAPNNSFTLALHAHQQCQQTSQIKNNARCNISECEGRPKCEYSRESHGLDAARSLCSPTSSFKLKRVAV
jgi:hypothetical protein